MASRVGFFCLFTFLLVGCTKDTIVEPSVTGKFVIDSFTATASGGTINATDSSYVSCTINYHYENWTGTISQPVYIVGTDTVRPTGVVEYYQPDPVNVPLTRRKSFWYRRHLAAQDSAFAYLIAQGSFWTRISPDSTYHYGLISVEDSVRIVVQN